MRRKRKRKKNPAKTLHRKAWRVFSEYLRRSSADENGEAACFTCGQRSPWRKLHAGHFFHRKLDFDPMNIHCQDAFCNTYGHGNLGRYAIRLVELHGLKAVQDLERRANDFKGYTIEEMTSILETYQQKIKELDDGLRLQ